MPSSRRERGGTLIEAMIAMGVLMIGGAGLVGLQTQSTHLMGDSRRTTRATVYAQDLLAQIELWDYDDPRLANSQAANDGDLGDAAMRYQEPQDPLANAAPADHGEADLTLNGRIWSGLPRQPLLDNQMERYWNVADGDDYNGNGVPDSKRIAVIIRWQGMGQTFRRAVFMANKINPADLR